MIKTRICPDCKKPAPTAFGRFLPHNIISFPYERRCWGSGEISSKCPKYVPLKVRVKEKVRKATETVVGKQGVGTHKRPYGMAAMAAYLAAMCASGNMRVFR